MLTRIERLSDRLVIALVILASVAVIMLAFLGGQTSSVLSTVGNAIGVPVPVTGSAPTGIDAGSGDVSQGPTSSGSGARVAIVDVARPDLHVIRTGTLDLQVADVARAVEAATREVEAVGGYLSGSEQVGEGVEVTASATYRIPVEAWTRALATLRAIAIAVVSIETRTDDVSAQVVDLAARIANLEVTERALQAIMSRATEIDDVLKIQKELTGVRGAIEEARARKQAFEDQAAFSTLTVHFGLKPVAAVIATQREFDPASEVDGASALLVDRLQHVAAGAIWFGIAWLPFLLVLAVGALGAVLIVRSRRRSGTGEATAT